MTTPVSRRRPRRLLTIAHSYAVTLNRRLAHEMARAGGDDWEVVAAGPSYFRGDLRPLRLTVEADEPCRVEPVPAFGTGKVHVMLYGQRLRRLLRDERWDLVHGWEEPFVFSGGQIARWLPRGVPLVYYVCQNIPKRYPPPFSWVERFSLNRSAGWIGMGQTVAEAQLSRPGYGRRPHRVISPGVDLDHFRPDPDAGAQVRRRLGWIEAGPPVVGFLGRLVPEKGLDLLTGALDAIDSPWRALFVGTGPMEHPLREWAARHEGRAVIATDVPHGQAAAYLNAMDLLCAPSQTRPNWREQFGRMLIEAFACGIPVLASDSGEIPHVVADAGLILGENDAPAWRRAIAELLESPNRRAEFRERGLNRARERFAWPVIAREHLKFFGELIDRHEGPIGLDSRDAATIQ